MRIWDISPGYLNRQSLLTEHRELHDLVSMIHSHKDGCATHPEVMRWRDHGWALRQRHQLLAAEMRLRGCDDSSPLSLRSDEKQWPPTFVDSPASQLATLAAEYSALEPGRIPLPRNVQQLWAQHKYSVMARDIPSYQRIGRWVATLRGMERVAELALELITLLRAPPKPKLIGNALLHMWGYVSHYSTTDNHAVHTLLAGILLDKVQQLVLSHNTRYLLHSTALSELGAWEL